MSTMLGVSHENQKKMIWSYARTATYRLKSESEEKNVLKVRFWYTTRYKTKKTVFFEKISGQI